MTNRTRDAQTGETAALIKGVDDFLDYAWDTDMKETKRLLTLIAEGFISSEICDSVETRDRSSAFGIWVKLMELMDALSEYRAGYEKRYTVVERN